MDYTELQVTTNFSFLRGGSHPEEMVSRAAELGYRHLGITDRNSLAGVVRAHVAAKSSGISIIPGVYLEVLDGPHVLCYPANINGYSQIGGLLTEGNLRTEKGSSVIYRNDLFNRLTDVRLIMLAPSSLNNLFELDESFRALAEEYAGRFTGKIYLGAQRRYRGDDAKWLFRLKELSGALSVPMLATNDVFYHEPRRRQLQDVVTCIREKCSIHSAGFRLYPNAERYLKDEQEMKRLFRQYPDAIRRTQEIVADCTFSLDELSYEYPEEITSDGRTPQEELAKLTWEGAKQFFGGTVPPKTSTAIRHELAFIEQMNYAAYFLTVYDIVRYARSKGILCQGRGSAANSTVCFCLGITSVNPEKFDLLFERFLSTARNEPPDIDVDFEHERREEVIQYIYEKYGRHRAAIVATVTQQHQRGAIRDVGKAMGLSADTIGKMAQSLYRYGIDAIEDEKICAEAGLDPADPHLGKVFQLTSQFMGFPRQLGQHTGGFIISRRPLSNLCPLHNARMEKRTCIEWNKDDIEALGFFKIDILALGMLTCIRKSFDLLREHYGLDLTLATIPQDDPAVYDMICRADTIGVFQIESRAQQTMLPRLKPRCFYDLVIEVAIVRPGPIQGDMVHPYLRRRNGEEPVEYPSKELEEILGRTLGVPLFQEQAMKVAIVAGGFSPSEADALRRSMATFKAKGKVSHFEEKLIKGMIARGYPEDYAKRVFRQLEGFGSYGFPESHAASFAQLVYVSSWIKCHYPDVFACALLNSLPMGFYQPAQIVTDAHNHGVEVLPVDVNFSGWDHSLERNSCGKWSLRLGFRQVKGIRQDDIHALLNARKASFRDIMALAESGIADTTLEKLADADAFQSMGVDRRSALWQVSVKDKPTALFTGQRQEEESEKQISLPFMPLPEQVVHDYASTSLSIKAHPLEFLRERFSLLNIKRSVDLKTMKNGQKVKVAGLVLVRQRPETAGGVWFITLEDETGFINLVLFQQVTQKHKREVMQSRLLMVEGKLQVEGDVIHVIVQSCTDATKMLRLLSSSDHSLPSFPRSDEVTHPKPADSRFGVSRDFK